LSEFIPRAQPLGDAAVTITFGTAPDAELLRKIHAAARTLSDASLPAVHDVVAGYLTIAVFYDALRVSYSEIAPILVSICEKVVKTPTEVGPSRQHEISVVYDGPDLSDVATATGLSTDEVIARHSGRAYSVDIIGFVPGFAYLSELDPALRLNRRPQPRPRVPAGSVAIAGARTGVYPLDTPGGWHILGHTGTTMFDPARDPPATLSVGDTVRFVRVD
jgi:KipI family sensor histidine kinase inhibitor